MEWNVMPLCRAHHQQQHKLGWFMFAELHPEVTFALEDREWSFGLDRKLRR